MMEWCAPSMGANLWGASPVWEYRLGLVMRARMTTSRRKASTGQVFPLKHSSKGSGLASCQDPRHAPRGGGFGYPVNTYLAYCQMGNPFHRVLHTRQGNLSRLMRHINGVYTRQFNRRHGLVGHLFQGRFKAILVDRDAYLMALCRYVRRNPVAAGLVATADEWAWSSDRAHVCMAPTPSWLDSDGLHGCLLGRSVASQRDRARAAQKYAALVTDADEGEGEASLWQTGLRQQGLPWRRRFRRSHAGAGVHRAAQRGRCSEGAAQVAQHVAGLPATNSGSARGAAHCIPGVRHHDDRDGQGVAAFCVAHQPTNCCGGSGRGWVGGKRQDLTP